MNPFDEISIIMLAMSVTLKTATSQLRIKVAHELERSEAILEKYGVPDEQTA